MSTHSRMTTLLDFVASDYDQARPFAPGALDPVLGPPDGAADERASSKRSTGALRPSLEIVSTRRDVPDAGAALTH